MSNPHDDGGPAQIEIERMGLDRKPYREKVDATVRGVFAIHRSIATLNDADHTLTHIPTGFAYISGVTRADAESALADIEAGGLDWSLIATPKDLTTAHREQGKAIRAKYERI